MQVLEEGVYYELNNFNKEGSQKIQFVSKNHGEDTYKAGTTNEEVVNMLIERFYFLQKKGFSVENQIIIENLKNVRRMLKKRLSNKITRLNKINEEVNYETKNSY